MTKEKSAFERFLDVPENRRLYEQEKVLVDATELLSEILKKRGASRAHLAKRIGKSKAFVTQLLRGNHNMTLRTLADLFWALESRVELRAVPSPEVFGEIADFDFCTQWAYVGAWPEHLTNTFRPLLHPLSVEKPTGRRSRQASALEEMPTEGVAA